MTVIAIDTSSRHRVVCISAGAAGQLLRARVANGEHVDTALPPLLTELIDSQLEALVVVTGPGSYTGVRAGMAAALGVAHPRGLALHGLNALEVLAAGTPPAAELWVAADAGRGAVYATTCRTENGVMSCRPAQRMTLVELSHRARGAPILSADDLGLEALVQVDPARALAAAVPRALAAPPLSQASLAAVYVT
jgi:tRNA threonylcarbamoyladenosine biosynthesis protein TsaB